MLIGIIAVLVVIAVWMISTYNGLVGSRELVRNSMGQIAVQVESRWDALSSLISATKKYSEHEAEVLMDITKSRTGINKDSDVKAVEKDSQAFEQAMTKLNVVVENYPELKASNVYENTMNKIDTYENNVRHSRMIFNDTVTKFNRKILVFPASIVAGMFGFKEEDYFKNTESKADMPSWE